MFRSDNKIIFKIDPKLLQRLTVLKIDIHIGILSKTDSKNNYFAYGIGPVILEITKQNCTVGHFRHIFL